MKKIPSITDALEMYTETPEGLPLWKSKGIELSSQNLLNNIFVLSHNIADYFQIKHNDLFRRNICKLQREGHLPDQLRIFAHLIEVGKSAKISRNIYALNRHQTER